MRSRRHLASLIILALALNGAVRATACPNCKEAFASQTGDAAKLKDGYYYSILLMVGMPFALVGAGAFSVIRAVRRGSLPEL